MLLHLAHPFIRGRRRIEVERALERLIDRHGEGDYLDCTLQLTFPSNANGVYLVKVGGPEVWRKFGVPSCWRKRQGFICGKRCGVTENIGPAARNSAGVEKARVSGLHCVPPFQNVPGARSVAGPNSSSPPNTLRN